MCKYRSNRPDYGEYADIEHNLFNQIIVLNEAVCSRGETFVKEKPGYQTCGQKEYKRDVRTAGTLARKDQSEYKKIKHHGNQWLHHTPYNTEV